MAISLNDPIQEVTQDGWRIVREKNMDMLLWGYYQVLILHNRAQSGANGFLNRFDIPPGEG